MSNCNNNVKHTCGSTNYSTCIHWEGDVNPQSELVGNTCLDQEIVDQDQYNQLENIWNEINLSELGNNCLEYVETDKGKIVVKNVLLKFEEKICELQERILELEERPLCSLPISDCVNTLCLEDACNNTITTFGEWMNAVTVKICETP